MGEHSEYEPPAGVWERWGETEPIRRALYPVAVAVAALLVGYGILTDELAALWLGVAAAVLIPGGLEVARHYAWSPRSVGDVVAEARRDGFADGVRAMTRRTPDRVAYEVRDHPDEVVTEALEAYQPTRELPTTRPSPSRTDRPNV